MAKTSTVAWIGDTFPYAQRQAVLARYLIGQIVGIGFGTALSGWLAEHFGWRAIFGLLAGVLLVIAFFLTMEARRQPVPAARSSMLQSFARMPGLLRRWPLVSIVATAFGEGFLIFGALAFRTIGDLLFVFDLDPLWQPLFQGVVLMVAVSLGAVTLFRVRNRLDWFG